MQRRNHRRVSAAMQYAVRTWLQATPFGRGTFRVVETPRGPELKQATMGARPAQIKAAAKQIVKSGKLPSNMRLRRAA